MNHTRTSALAFTDWMKIFAVLATALVAFWYVYSVYTEPFDLAVDVRLENILQTARSTSPLVRPVPPGGGGRPAEITPADPG